MMQELLFYLTVFLSNVIQAITGFAGTMLAMAPSMQFIGADMAKPMLTSFGFLICAVMAVRERRFIDWKTLMRMLVCMLAGLAAGMVLEHFLTLDRFLPIYGVFLIVYAIWRLLSHKPIDHLPAWVGVAVLFGAGVMHALFLSSGALMVIYASTVLRDKNRFRATLSVVGVLLCAVLLVQYGIEDKFTPEVLRMGAIGLLPLGLGLFVGNLLHSRISQSLFMRICYILLIVNGIWILVG